MSLKKTKEQLIRLLGEADNLVIALSGKWGTGKTHLWEEVKAESDNDKVRNALYVSLFGLSSIDQVKRRLIEAAIPGVESHGGLFDGLKNLFNTGVEAASKHYKALAAINALNVLLMAPVVLRNKLIVIDDIERKHENLGINEVLGFIDEYSKQHGARFVLVLNDDKLSSEDSQLKLWETFREKIIDHEIKLSTTADEAFSIAINLRPSRYTDAIKSASITCRLTNIRIILRVIKVANQILTNRHLESSILARVVPSIVLFSAIYYRGLDDGPDFQFALNVGDFRSLEPERDDEEESTLKKKQANGWRMLMQELGIYSCDEFEERLVEFLESGLLDPASTEAIINRYVLEKDTMEARDTAQNFLKRFFWDHRINQSQLLDEAAALPEIAGFLDPFIVTELNSVLTELPGGEAIGAKIIDSWISAFKTRDPSTVNDENPFNRPLHPRIQDEFKVIKEATQVNTTVVDACMHLIDNSGWGTIQELAFRRATEGDFEAAIREIEDIDTFARFMRQMMKMLDQRKTYDPHFGSATERFLEACKTIANDTTSPRLASMIKRFFSASSIEL